MCEKIRNFAPMMKKDTVLILSGGMDSVTLLYDSKDRVALALTFDYGSNR